MELVQGGEVDPYVKEASRSVLGSKGTGNFLLQFHHPPVTLGLVVVKGDGEVVDKAEYKNLRSLQSLQQAAGGGASYSLLSFSEFLAWEQEEIGGEALIEDGLIADIGEVEVVRG